MGRGKRACFNYTEKRVWRKLKGWESKLLSQAGREVLLKSVIQAIPTYAMGASNSLLVYVMKLKV